MQEPLRQPAQVAAWRLDLRLLGIDEGHAGRGVLPSHLLTGLAPGVLTDPQIMAKVIGGGDDVGPGGSVVSEIEGDAGGYLRGLTEKFLQGELRLARSYYGLRQGGPRPY